MSGKQAKILSNTEVNQLLHFARRTRNPLRNRVIVLLSAKAGMRAGEIAALTWDMVLDPQSQIGSVIELRDSAAKKGSGRLIPIHLDLAKALAAWRKSSGRKASGPKSSGRKASGLKSSADSIYVVRSERGGQMTPLSVVVWFNRAFHKVGLKGCSSHSGRRTFITRAARLVHRAGGSLRDVQLLAGHRSIQTTQRYIDGDSDAQRRLVSLI
jgi:integrase/recombinase XerD